MSTDLPALAQKVADGDKTAVARALNLVEDRRGGARRDVAELLALLADAPRTAAGHRVGLTGPPGVGKSTLAAALTRNLRERGRTVGVIAIDPTSIRSGGSLLGDRARMGFDPQDAGVLVRSLATAGQSGGLAYAANAAVRVLAAAFDVVLVETTGVGQSETDVVHVADTVALVVQPGSGDVLQFLKAGVMEIPDVLVVNKADMGDVARRTVADLQGALQSASAVGVEHGGGWTVPIIRASSLGAARSRGRDPLPSGSGIDDLVDALDRHRAALGEHGIGTRRRRGEVAWVLQMLERRYGEHAVETLGGRPALRRTVGQELGEGTGSPVGLSDDLGRRYLETVVYRFTHGPE